MEIRDFSLSRKAKIFYTCSSVAVATAICIASGGGGYLFGYNNGSVNAQETGDGGFPISDASCSPETQTGTPVVVSPTSGSEMALSPTLTPTETPLMECRVITRTPTVVFISPEATSTKDNKRPTATPTRAGKTQTSTPTSNYASPMPSNTHPFSTLVESSETPDPTSTPRPTDNPPTPIDTNVHESTDLPPLGQTPQP